MTGNENIEIGDKLICISNTGLCSVGDKETIIGISNESINFNFCLTSWRDRKGISWSNYKLEKCKPTEKILDFQKEFQKVEENNKLLLQKLKADKV